MPEPRAEKYQATRVIFEPGARDPAAARRRYRHGTAVYPGKGGGPGTGLPVEIRNGMPEPGYVYSGTGRSMTARQAARFLGVPRA